MNIIYSKQAVKTIKRLEAPTKKRIGQAILQLPKGDIRPLQSDEGFYRLRVGDWRIIYSYEEDEIYIKSIAPRGEAYK